MENNPVEKNTVAGKVAKAKEKELEEWLCGLDGMGRLVDDYVGDKILLWEKIMDRQGMIMWQLRAGSTFWTECISPMVKRFTRRSSNEI